MTEKRYKRYLSFVLDDYANGSDRLMTIREVIPRLNELYEENEQLKTQLQTYKTGSALLKATMDRHRTENQQIRDTIKEMYNNERTELGKSTLKQLLEVIQ
jgi:DNA anti-recombination protein RmuC